MNYSRQQNDPPVLSARFKNEGLTNSAASDSPGTMRIKFAEPEWEVIRKVSELKGISVTKVVRELTLIAAAIVLEGES